MPSGIWQLRFSFTVSNLIVSSFAEFSRTTWHNMGYVQWRHMNSEAYQTNSLHICFAVQHPSPQGWESVQNSRGKCFCLLFLGCNSFKAWCINGTTQTPDTNLSFLFCPFATVRGEGHQRKFCEAMCSHSFPDKTPGGLYSTLHQWARVLIHSRAQVQEIIQEIISAWGSLITPLWPC